jgi:hypothetical protein
VERFRDPISGVHKRKGKGFYIGVTQPIRPRLTGRAQVGVAL